MMRTQDPSRSVSRLAAAPDSAGSPGEGTLVDVRGPRFSSAVTALVLAVALVVQGSFGIALVAVQVAVFAIATVLGVTRSPWAHLFRAVRRRAGWGPPTQLESATPPRFAQACGLVVAGSGLLLLVTGAAVAGWIAVGVVLALATVLATSGLCVGCEMWLLGQRLVGGRA
jgi:hypothetical protein